MTSVAGWAYFAVIQIVSIVLTMVGWILLIPCCLAQAWEPGGQSIKDGRPIDQWKWRWLRFAFNNPEDGVSGQAALVWVDGALSHYKPNAWAPWRAYCWSAWRNSADGLKYVFAWKDGPLVTFKLFGAEHKLGWQLENGVKVPVIS